MLKSSVPRLRRRWWSPRLRRLPSRDVRLQALDVGELERTNLPAAEQWLDVGFNAALVRGEGRRLDRAVAPPKDAAGFGFRQSLHRRQRHRA